MRRLVPLLTLVVVAACADAPPLEPTAATPRLNAVASSGTSRYVVLFKGAAPGDFESAIAARGGTIELLHQGARIAIVGGLSSDDALTIEQSASVESVIEDFEYQGVSHLAEPAVDAAELASLDPGMQSQANPATAFFFPRQWHHRAIRANVAWAAGRLGSSNVDVAILDSGLDPSYPDLGVLVDQSRARSFVPTNGTNPLLPTDDQLIATFFPGRPLWSDLNGHGSHVGSTVSSLGAVNAGVTSRVRLIPVKVLNARGSGSFGGIINGILYATDADAEVINMSLGALFPRAGNRPFTRVLDAATKYARNSGVTVVVAAGNDGRRLHPSNNALYDAFCSTKNVICVSATGPNRSLTAAGLHNPNGPNYLPSVDLFAVYTNFGIQHIDVAAPGGNLPVNSQGQQIGPAVPVWAACSRTSLQFVQPPGTPPPPPFYRKTICADPTLAVPPLPPNTVFTIGYVGTSMASPHAAGLAALLVEQVGRSPELIKDIIKSTADDILEFGKPGKDDFYGNGRINVARALGL